LSAYDTVLEADPEHEDARHNRALVARLKEQVRQQSRQQQRESGAQGRSGGNQQEDGSSREPDPRDAMDQSESTGGRDDAGRERPESEATGTVDRPLVEPPLTAEEQQAMAQWLRRVPDDPGGLLRRKFQLEYSRRRAERPEGTDAW
jgi:Ca-activated chloride channel family protein